MAIAFELGGHAKDLGGGFTVRRLLPAARQRSVGPFVFFDHFGPVTEMPGVNHDVRPHPHIGLATVTYLFEGAMMHRDSLGSEQLIAPGAINWMSAGRGIVHSERRPESLQASPYVNHGLQLWVALPREQEESEPTFAHTPASAIPEVVLGQAQIRVLAGSAFGTQSPVATLSRTLYLDVLLAQGAVLELPALEQEMAVYPVQGDLLVDGQPVSPATMAVLEPGKAVQLSAPGTCRLAVIGGAPLDGPRHMWWNFVSSRKERILQAAADWEAGRMGSVPGDTESIPLPAQRFTA
ncbi:MAG: pirin family protein [Burkholderiales bacterium]|nr:pirin family protein [Burkholderiales bacterium]